MKWMLAGRYKATGKEVSSTALLSGIVRLASETNDDPAGKLTDQVDLYENQVLLKTTSSDITESLYYIKRQASICYKVLTLMPELINPIAVKPGEEALLQDVRDQHLKMQTLYGQTITHVNRLRANPVQIKKGFTASIAINP